MIVSEQVRDALYTIEMEAARRTLGTGTLYDLDHCVDLHRALDNLKILLERRPA